MTRGDNSFNSADPFFALASRRPLSLLDQWTLVFTAITGEFDLTKSALRVLIVLLQHQNNKTGRCDPSIPRLMKLTKLSDTSVKSGLSELYKAELVFKKRGGKGKSNAYRFSEIGALGSQLSPSLRKEACESQEASFPKVRKQTSPKKEKEKKKEKSHQKPEHALAISEHKRVGISSSTETRARRTLHNLEHAIYNELERLGLPKATITNINDEIAESIYEAYLAGQLNLQEATSKIVKACIEKDDPKVRFTLQNSN